MNDKERQEQEERKERKERIKSVKLYSRIIGLFFSFIITVLMGTVLGYFFNKWFEGNNWILICTLVFFLIAIVNFYRQLLRIR